jgi:hypothetical protein
MIKNKTSSQIPSETKCSTSPTPTAVSDVTPAAESSASAPSSIAFDALHGISIIPLLGNLDDFLSKKKKYQGRFDYVFLSQGVAQWIGSNNFKSILRCPTDDGREKVLVEVESGKYIFQLKEKDQKALHERIKSLAEGQGLMEILPLQSTCGIAKVDEHDKYSFMFQSLAEF